MRRNNAVVQKTFKERWIFDIFNCYIIQCTNFSGFLQSHCHPLPQQAGMGVGASYMTLFALRNYSCDDGLNLQSYGNCSLTCMHKPTNQLLHNVIHVHSRPPIASPCQLATYTIDLEIFV